MMPPSTIHNSLLNVLYPQFFKETISNQKAIPIVLKDWSLYKNSDTFYFLNSNRKFN